MVPKLMPDESLDGAGAILIVEDDADVEEAMREILEGEGYPILSAANGEEALRILAEKPRPRLILLDLMMPVMNGWELLRALRESAKLARIPVVVVSAVGSSAAPPGCAPFRSRSTCRPFSGWCKSTPTS